MRLDITKTEPKEGYVETYLVEFPPDFVDKWQYHQRGLIEQLKHTHEPGMLFVDFPDIYGNLEGQSITFHRVNSHTYKVPALVVHRLRTGDKFGAKIHVSFMEEWSQAREPMFDTLEEAFHSLGQHLVEEFKPRKVDEGIQ